MRFLLAALLFVFFLSGCNEEEILLTPPTSAPIADDFGTLDAQSAKKFEIALSKALTNPDFVEALRLEFIQFKTGDSEVLISEILEKKEGPGLDKSSKSPRTIFLENLSSSMSSSGLDDYLSANPNYIFGLRGDIASFFDDDANSAVAYIMPENFDENTTSVEASFNGTKEPLDLTSKLDKAVVVLQKSERHADDGTYLLDIFQGGDITGVGNPWTQPSSVECPEGVNNQILRSFTAEETNGGILLSYGIDPSNTNDLIIQVFRLGPGEPSFSLISERSESDDRLFYDADLQEGLNVEYRYRLEVLISTTGSDGVIIECDAETVDGTTKLYATATATTTYTRVASFTGRNISNSAISYIWSPPENTPVNEYRLSVLGDNGTLTEVAVINPSQNQLHQYTYNYPPEKRGELVEMQIQYRAAGNTWVGDFYDRTYGSFRNGDEPFIYYGIRISDIGFYEDVNIESQLLGAPEIRLITARANSGGENPTATLREVLVNMQNCCFGEIAMTTDGVPKPWEEILAALQNCANTSDRLVYYNPIRENYDNQGLILFDRWDSDLLSGAISIMTTETDAETVRVLSAVETTADNREVNFSFGIRQPTISPFSSTTIGTTETFNDMVARTISYPGDIDINEFTVFYHDPLVRRAGSELFGFSTITMGNTSGGTNELPLNSCPALDFAFQ